MIRTVEQWKEILDGMFPRDAARRILGDITHYREGGPHELVDQEQLGNALQAFASLQQES
jgi:hypothetical protein